ncbi:uncharacterized protein EI90DRAFT_702057 [Cantharellus anzutake]|uniref:uncharacterized protein n=1 Tax=Cantharellus anzutake TaxID=1750568 RepID=UPI001902D002|nr:uncharacterized protein EI90DRAFT_702057 [Cantharellus anzutake]KAF8332776.1 hypothetical protein EI90DRAFT_702057 [Cantharellus anzutake]
MAEDEEAILQALEAHGKDFMSQFGMPELMVNRKRKSEVAHDQPKSKQDDVTAHILEKASASIIKDEHGVEVVFFANSTPKAPERVNDKSFMSSKVSHITAESVAQNSGAMAAEAEGLLLNNDKELYRLVHTELLPKSIENSLDMTPGKRGRALEARVLELASIAKLGQGARKLKELDALKQPLRIQKNIKITQKKREAEELERAKESGNYHPVLKKFFKSQVQPKSVRKRPRGLSMGIGKYTSSGLQLSKRDVARINGGDSSESHGSRGKPRGPKGQR